MKPQNRHAGSICGAPANLGMGMNMVTAGGAPVRVAEVDARVLAGVVLAVFRSDGHICNVLTHISGARWDLVEQALRTILDRRAEASDMTPLARNIVELLCADRGVSGRIVRPCFETLLTRLLTPDSAAGLRAHVARLLREQAGRGAAAAPLSK